MALSITMKNDKKPEDGLFNAVFVTPADFAVLKAARDLIPGLSFNLSFFDVCATAGGKAYNVKLPVTLTSILKGTASAEQKGLCRKALLSLLETVIKGSDASVVMPTVLSTAEAAEKAVGPAVLLTPDAFPDAEALPKAAPVTKAKPTNNVIALKDAKALGQKVRGTDKTSIYYTVGLSPRVKLAMRVKNNVLSVRAEGSPNATEHALMLGSGMSQSDQGHYSLHLKLEDSPLPRAVGAILLGLGVEFTEILTKVKDLKVEQ